MKNEVNMKEEWFIDEDYINKCRCCADKKDYR
jgi:hypothetical protein